MSKATARIARLDGTDLSGHTPERGRFISVNVRVGGVVTSSWGLHTGNMLTVPSEVQLTRPDLGPVVLR